MGKVLIVASVASMIDQFNRPNIKLLMELGYDVHVACNFIEGSTCSSEKIQQLKTDLQTEGVTFSQIDFARNIARISQNYRAYRQIKLLLKQEKFDLIHCHSPIGGLLTRMAAKKYRKKGTRVIYTAHGFHFYKGAPLKNWLLYYPVEWVCAHWTDELITINKEDFARAQEHMHAERVTYIPGVGVDLKKFSPRLLDEDAKISKISELGIDKGKFILLSVGELQSRKNHIVVINALCELKNPNIVYLIAGVGELHDQYQEIIEKSGMSDNIKLLGYRSDISELCEIADCFVHPSVREGLGIAPLEAMACGLPLISADINGIKDYTENGKTGCCVNPHSVEEMKAAITKMYTDPSFRETCGRHNIDVVKSFSLEESLRATEQIYNAGGVKHLYDVYKQQLLRRAIGVPLDAVLLLSVGELNSNKNHEVVIRAMAQINDDSVHYAIAGTGNLHDYLVKLANALGVGDRVHLLGYRNDVADLYKAADVCVFPSIREGLGIAAIEGMASGLPLICSDNRGTRDYAINGENAMVCRYDATDEFARAVKTIVSDENMSEKMGKFNLEKSLKYDVKNLIAQMKKIYGGTECQNRTLQRE